MSSSALDVMRFDRRSRWNVLAKRWASSRMRCSMNKPSLPRAHLDGFGATRHVHLLELFGECGDRDLVGETELVDDPLGHVQLPLATIDDEQLGRVGELAGPVTPLLDRAVTLVDVRLQPAREHLFHGAVVVVAGDVDLEPAVFPLVRETVFEHDHRTDVVGALQVRHVVALDAQRRLGQVERLLQFGQRS